MRHVKKYAAILVLLLVYPFVHFVATHFIVHEGDEIYAYIPQESDFVVEINTGNFIAEIMYQRIFEETYFMEKVYPSTDREPEARYVDSGFDFFGKMILFREQWANESIWIAVLKYTNQDLVRNYLTTNFSEGHFDFSDDYVVIQLSPSSNQVKMDEHLKKICSKEVKSFNERAILSQVFDPTKEINCYIIPKSKANNQLIDGYISFDFLADKIAINGSFTPITDLNEFEPAAYAIAPEKGLSLRSSFNFFNSIYWFNSEKIDNLPGYSQLAFDYDGVECRMINRNMGFTTPFKSFPQIDVHFDILKKEVWYAFLDSIKANPSFQVDTINHSITTAEGAYFKYVQTDRIFELTQDSVTLTASTDDNLYLDLQIRIDDLIDRTVFTVDQEHPPSDLEQKFGLMAANTMLSQIKLLTNLELCNFQLRGDENGDINTSGQLLMKEKNGSALIESLSFGSAILSFLQGK